jgi:hypothetical protein
VQNNLKLIYNNKETDELEGVLKEAVTGYLRQ